MTTIYNISSLQDNSLKIKQSYITNSEKHKIVILKEEVVMHRRIRFNISQMQRILRMIMRAGFFPSEVEFDSDELHYTSKVRIVFEYTDGLPPLMKVLKPITKELIADDLIYTTHNKIPSLSMED
jgi:hypothetical protein